MSNVLEFKGNTLLPIDPDKVLNEAVGKLENVLVIGIGKDGELYLSSDNSSVAENLLLLKRAERFLMEFIE